MGFLFLDGFKGSGAALNSPRNTKHWQSLPCNGVHGCGFTNARLSLFTRGGISARVDAVFYRKRC